MNKKKSVLSIALLLIMAVTLFGCGGGDGGNGDGDAAEGKTYNLILGHCDPEDLNDPYHISSVAFAEKVKELTDGRVNITVYPNAQLGDERTVIEAVQNGSVDFSVVTNAVTSNFQPITKIMDLPFLFDSLETAREVTGSEAGQAVLDSMSEVGIKGLGFTENGFRFVLNNKTPIKAPADLAGLKLRVMQSPVYISFYDELKSSAVPLAFGEVFTAVSQGTVDGFDLPLPVVLSSKLYEVSQYMSDVRYTYTSLMIIMNEDKFNSYPEDIQQAFFEAAEYARTVCFETNDKVLADGFSVLEATDIDITYFDDIDFDGFRAASQPVWEEHTDSDRAKDILNQIVEMTN
jgi:tripartite ATP-independent transporter DctP family solute receptor